jgi:hypothetical protein
MTKEEFRLLCNDCAASRERYTKAAIKLCAKLETCDAPIGVKDRLEVDSMRNLEAHLHSEYEKTREKFMKAVFEGTGLK